MPIVWKNDPETLKELYEILEGTTCYRLPGTVVQSLEPTPDEATQEDPLPDETLPDKSSEATDNP